MAFKQKGFPMHATKSVLKAHASEELDRLKKDVETFQKQHDEDGTLTSEGFKYMEPLIRKEIQIYNRELYVFTVRIKPEYEQKYLKTNAINKNT